LPQRKKGEKERPTKSLNTMKLPHIWEPETPQYNNLKREGICKEGVSEERRRGTYDEADPTPLKRTPPRK